MARYEAHSLEPTASQKVAVFLHSGDYDRVHQGLSIAAAAVAMGRRVDVFFFWWALDRVARGEIDEPEFPGRSDVTRRFETRQVPTLRALLQHLRESGLCSLQACTGSMAVLADEPSGMERSFDRFVGWAAILQMTAGVTDRFYL